MSVATLPTLLKRHWELVDPVVEPVEQGMNSITHSVQTVHGRWAAKWVVPASRDALLRGATATRRLALSGVRLGRAVRTRDGELVVDTGDGALALLSWVDGRPLDPSSAKERKRMGRTLAKVHAAGVLGPRDDAFFPWFEQLAAEAPAWVRKAVAGVTKKTSKLPPVTWGLLHMDPAPEAFRVDGDRVGLIDWTAAEEGPLLYDVASAVMYLGDGEHADEFLEGYVREGLLGKDELKDHLKLFRRLRWAVQAAYFAKRIADNDLTGISGPADNLKGLEDARAGLAGLGVSVS